MKLTLADKGVRFTNFLIDMAAIGFITLVVILVVSLISGGICPEVGLLLWQCIYLLYYFVLEAIFQQTLGKMVTRTVVVHKSGRKPSLTNIFFRSIFRVPAINALSFAFGSHIGMHDLFSNTRLVSSRSGTPAFPAKVPA
jgi:uncharacterized RDD family membrane protein YckC